jgi:hypothetical protein
MRTDKKARNKTLNDTCTHAKSYRFASSVGEEVAESTLYTIRTLAFVPSIEAHTEIMAALLPA